jgi:hypothetical protein
VSANVTVIALPAGEPQGRWPGLPSSTDTVRCARVLSRPCKHIYLQPLRIQKGLTVSNPGYPSWEAPQAPEPSPTPHGSSPYRPNPARPDSTRQPPARPYPIRQRPARPDTVRPAWAGPIRPDRPAPVRRRPVRFTRPDAIRQRPARPGTLRPGWADPVRTERPTPVRRRPVWLPPVRLGSVSVAAAKRADAA